MEDVLNLQALDTSDELSHDMAHGPSNLSLLADCDQSTVSVLACV